jgi:hypothetical protein
VDKKIELLIDEIPKLTNIVTRDSLTKAMNDLMEASQELLKAEWEKCKVRSRVREFEEEAGLGTAPGTSSALPLY